VLDKEYLGMGYELTVRAPKGDILYEILEVQYL